MHAAIAKGTRFFFIRKLKSEFSFGQIGSKMTIRHLKSQRVVFTSMGLREKLKPEK